MDSITLMYDLPNVKAKELPGGGLRSECVFLFTCYFFDGLFDGTLVSRLVTL